MDIIWLASGKFNMGCLAAYKEFSTARIPIRRQVILNEAISHLVANVLPNLGVAEMARAQVQLALRDFNKSAYWRFDSEVKFSHTLIELINSATSKPKNYHAKQIDSRDSHRASSLICKRAALSVFLQIALASKSSSSNLSPSNLPGLVLNAVAHSVLSKLN